MGHVSRARKAVNSAASSQLVYWRQNFDPQRDTPVSTREELLRWGGTNDYGEPLWRVILSENHRCLRDGVWENRDEAQDSILFGDQNQIDGNVGYTTRNVAPVSVTSGQQWVPLYPCKGWILERWFPAYCFGDRVSWESVMSKDGVTPMMGPYPARGDYWMMKGPWEAIPTSTQLRQGISSWENSTKHMHGKIDQALFDATMKNFMKMLDEDEEAQYFRLLNQIKGIREGVMKDWMTNPRLTAERNRILNPRGLTSHV